MPIVTSDIKFRQSVTTGSAGDSVSGGAAGTNLGKYMSSTDLVDNTLNNLFPDVTGDENAASNVDYQCVFVYNSHATLTWQNPVAWVVSQVAGGADIAIGIDTTAASAHTNSSAQGLTIANKNVAPVGVTFSTPTSKGAGLSVGSLTPGQVRAVWVRRTANNTAALNSDGGQIRVEGDSSA